MTPRQVEARLTKWKHALAVVSDSGDPLDPENSRMPAFYAYARKGELAWVDIDPAPGTHGGHWLDSVTFEENTEDGIKVTTPWRTVWLYNWQALEGEDDEAVKELEAFHASRTDAEHTAERRTRRPW